MKKTAKKVISVLLSFVMIMGLTVFSFAEEKIMEFKDIKGHWAQAEMQILIDNGILGGYKDHTIRPNNKISRAEAIKIINKSLQLEGVTDLSIINYTDVKKDAWYANEVAIAVKNGYIEKLVKNNRLKPNEMLKREELAVMMVSALKLDISSSGGTELFMDKDKISEAYRNAFEAAVRLKFFGGYSDGSIRPQATVTRAEFAAVISRVKAYKKLNPDEAEVIKVESVIEEPKATSNSGSHSGSSNTGNLVIDRPGTYSGDYRDILISPLVGDGTVILDNMIIRGNLEIQGGGSNSIILCGTTVADGNVTINKTVDGETVRLCIMDEVSISNVEIKSDAILESVSDNATFENLTISGKSETEVNGEQTKVEKVDVNSEGVIVSGNGKIHRININANNAEIKLEKEVRIKICKNANGTRLGSKGTLVGCGSDVILCGGDRLTTIKDPEAKIKNKKIGKLKTGDKIGNAEVKSNEGNNKIILKYDKQKAVGEIGEIKLEEKRIESGIETKTEVKFKVKSIKIDNVELSRENVDKLMKKANGSDFVGDYIEKMDLSMISTPMSHVALFGNTITVDIENESEMMTTYTVVLEEAVVE